MTHALTILTMSFARDFPLCKLLCETIDECIPPHIDHVLAVPAADLSLFSALKSTRRIIVAEDQFIPKWLHRIPPPPDWIRDRVRFARRNVYFSSKGPPVRGWIVQQLMKLQASEQIDSDIIMHVDSDVAFVRPFDTASIMRDGRVALLRFPGDGNTPAQQPWHRAASAALGLQEQAYFGSGYISNCVLWRRSTARAMLERIAVSTGRNPMAYLSRTKAFSEYILYGVFCEFVAGLEAAGHFASDRQLCKTLWTMGSDNAVAAEDALGALGDEVAVGIQSTLPVPMEKRYAIVRNLRRGVST